MNKISTKKKLYRSNLVEAEIDVIQNNLTHKTKINMIEDYGINGDFVESMAFAFLAIRSYKKLPITFPGTTNCNEPCTGGTIIEN